MESTIINIKLKNNNNLFIISLYCQGSNDTGLPFEISWQQMFDELKLENPANHFVIAGDLNAKHTSWGNSINNNKGVQLYRWLLSNKFYYRTKLLKPDEATYTPHGSYLDIAIVDDRLVINNNEFDEIPTHYYESDHKGIEIKINDIETSEDSAEIATKHQYNFVNIDWIKWTADLQKLYNKHLKNNRINKIVPNDRNITTPEIESYIISITDILSQSLKSNTPKIRRKNNVECYTNGIIEKLYKHESRLISLLKNLRRNGSRNSQQTPNQLKAGKSKEQMS